MAALAHHAQHLEGGIKFTLGVRPDGSSHVQSVMFGKEIWSREAAHQWLNAHGFAAPAADETYSYWRYRQESPAHFVRFATMNPVRRLSASAAQKLAAELRRRGYAHVRLEDSGTGWLVKWGRESHRNFLGFGSKKKKPVPIKRSSLTVSQAMQAAYRAGEQSGDTGLFSSWAESAGFGGHGAQLRAKLRKEYERGFEAEHARAMGRRASEATRRTAGSGEFRGHRIWQDGGGWRTDLDPETLFDSEKDVKAFIGSAATGWAGRKLKRYNKHDVDRDRLHEVVTLSPGIQALEKGLSYFNPRKRNPAEAAAEKYAEFHGMPSGSVEIVEEDVHYHEHLAEIGDLCKLIVHTVTGLEASYYFAGYSDELHDFDPNVPRSERPMLATSEDGNQLYVVGGDQELDLGAIEMDSAEWLRDSMVIGEIVETTYQTKKGFDDFETVAYYHELGEDSGERPTLLYDYMNKTLAYSGGQYHIGPEPEGGGGSIFN